MAAEGQEEPAKSSSGFLTRILGRGDSKPKYAKANLGEKNQLFYDNELKRWRKAGEEVSASDLAPPPPPVVGSGFRPSTAASTTSQSRYADAGGFGKAAAPSSTGTLIPRPGSAPQAVPFLASGGQTAAGGVPKFFQPGNNQQSGPVWGAAKAAPPPPTAGPTAPVSTQPPAFSTGLSTEQMPSRISAQSAFSPKNDGQHSARSNRSDDKFSWSAWRQQDEERRHRERQSASQLGAEMMDTFGAGEDPSSSNMPATTSFTDLEDPGLQDTSTSQPGWQPSGQRIEAAGRLLQPGTPPATQDSWATAQQNRLDPSFTGTASPATLLDSANDIPTDPGQAVQDLPGEEGFFGEPGTSAAELPNGFNHAETGFLESEANQAVGEELYGDWGGRTSEGFEAGYAEGDVSTQEQQQPLQEGEEGQAEQTFGGGYTHQQLLEWAAYYVSESQFSEEEAQNWVDACLAQPDPPGFVPAPQEEATLQAENAQQDGETGFGGEPAEYQEGILVQTAISSAEGEAETLAEDFSSGDAQHRHEAAAEAEQANGAAGVGEENAKEKLRQMLEAQKAQDPNFAKLTGPMPWDGVISDQDETPPDSPRAFLRANSRRASPGLKSQQLKPANMIASSKVAAVEEGKAASAVKSVVQNPLGAKWLDELSKKVNSTQWIEPGQHQAKRAGSVRQLFERKFSEPSKQASLPSANTKKAIESGSQSKTPRAAVKLEDSSAKIADVSPKPSPFQVHNNGLTDLPGTSQKRGSGAESQDAQVAKDTLPTVEAEQEEPSKQEAAGPALPGGVAMQAINGYLGDAHLHAADGHQVDATAQENGWADDDFAELDTSGLQGEDPLASVAADLQLDDSWNPDATEASNQPDSNLVEPGEEATSLLEATAAEPAPLPEPPTEADSVELRTQLAAAVQECQELQEKLDLLTSEHQSLLNDAQEGLEDREQLSREVQALQEHSEALEASEKDLQRRLKEAQQAVKQHSELRIKRQQLQKDLEEMRKEHEGLQARFAASQQQPPALAQASADQQDLQQRLQQLKEESSMELHRLEKLRAELTSENEQLQAKLQSSEAQRTEAEQEAESLRDQLTAAEDEREGWQDRLETLEEDRAHLKAELSAAADGASSLAKEQAAKETLQSELHSLSQELSALKQQVSDARSSQTKAEGQISDLQRQLQYAESEAQAERDKLLRQIEGLEGEVSSLRESLAAGSASQDESKAQEMAELLVKLQAAEADSQNWQNKAKAVRAKATNTLAKHRKEAEEKLHAIEEERDSLQSQLSGAQQIGEQVSRLQQEKEDLQQQLTQAEELQASLASDSEALTQLREALKTAQEFLQKKDAQLAEAQASSKAREAELEQQLQEKTEASQAAERRIQELVASQEEAAQKLEESEKRLTDLEAENEELFGKATAAEEEVDAATGKLFAANNDLDAARQHWEEAERRVQELRESRQHEASKGEKELSEKLETLGTEIGKVQEQWHSSQAEVQRQQGELEDAVEKLEEAQKQLRKEEANSQAKNEQIQGLTDQVAAMRQQLAQSQEVSRTLARPGTSHAGTPQDSPRLSTTVPDFEAQLEEKQEEMTELLACLGQEVAKIDALSELLLQQGMDKESIQAILDEVEAKMGYEAAEGEAEAEASETEAPAILTGSAADLSFLSQPFDDAEGDWSFS